MDANFQITLEDIGPLDRCHIFRVSFDGSDDRYLLDYPEVSGLQFRSLATGDLHEFKTGILATGPRDEFVLNPNDRIAFDLRAIINQQQDDAEKWMIDLVDGEYEVVFSYSLDPDRRRFDFLNKGSRFADLTKPWSGTVLSNPVRFSWKV